MQLQRQACTITEDMLYTFSEKHIRISIVSFVSSLSKCSLFHLPVWCPPHPHATDGQEFCCLRRKLLMQPS